MRREQNLRSVSGTVIQQIVHGIRPPLPPVCIGYIFRDDAIKTRDHAALPSGRSERARKCKKLFFPIKFHRDPPYSSGNGG